MIVHYLVIWTDKNKGMESRLETPMDVEVDGKDLLYAEDRFDAIKGEIDRIFGVKKEDQTIINICRL